MSQEKVSFTVRRPTPLSRSTSSGPDTSPSFKVPPLPRHLTANGDSNKSGSGPGSPLARSATNSPKPPGGSRLAFGHDSDSSDEDDERVQDELVSGFDMFGAERVNENRKKTQQGPLVIPALADRDWRVMARKRKMQRSYVPDSAQAGTGADGSVGGLGTTDTMNAGPVAVGLQIKKQAVKAEMGEDGLRIENQTGEVVEVVVEAGEKQEGETEDQKAIRAILAGDDAPLAPSITIIPPMTEQEAYRQDMEDLPDSSSMEDYARVPVAEFGAALLRGMGWKEGMAASKTGKGIVQPWVPAARPAFLGIGAKQREVLDDGSKKKKVGSRPDMRYVPVIKREKEVGNSREGSKTPHYDSEPNSRRRSRSPGRGTVSASASRRNSRTPSPSRRRYEDVSRHERRDRYDRERDREKDRRRERDREYEREKPRDRDDRASESNSRRERDREHERERARERDDRPSDRRRDRG